MKTTGEYRGAQRSLEGELLITFAVDEDSAMLEDLAKLKDKKLSIEAKRYSEPRSNNANKYFWKLCDLLAEKMASTQDEIHDLMLYRYGQRADLTFSKDKLPAMQEVFDIVIILEDYGEAVDARCFMGSRFYDTQEMARLIEGTVNDAKEQGIQTEPPQEIERLVAEWEKVRAKSLGRN